MSKRYVSVRLTQSQIEVLMSLCGYAQAGGPEDISMDRSNWNKIPVIHRRLADAIEETP